MSERQTPLLTDRIDARLAFNGHLLSIFAGVPVELAERVAAAWFEAVREHCDRGRIVVLGACVVGRPQPLLLEVAHHARRALAADHERIQANGWKRADYLRHLLEAPQLFERVIEALADGQGADRIVGWPSIDAELARPLVRDRDQIGAVIDLTVALAHTIGTCAHAVRIGDAAVLSTRPTPQTARQTSAA